MDVEKNVKLDMERNVEETLSKLISVKSKERFWRNTNCLKFGKIYIQIK